MRRGKAWGSERMAIKRVRVDQLKPGMYIHDLNCGWLQHGFLTGKSFYAKLATQLAQQTNSIVVAPNLPPFPFLCSDCSLSGTSMHIAAGRPGERQDEYLIGDLELPFTRAVTFKGVPHYAISFRERQANPPTVALTSENADRLTTEEIVDMITRSAEIERS